MEVGVRALLRLAFILSVSSPAFAQWTNVPPPEVPRTPDGKPNLSAPAPRLPDGKPDLSGIWNPPTGYLRNLAKDLKEDVPFQPWAKALYDERAAGKYLEGGTRRELPAAGCAEGPSGPRAVADRADPEGRLLRSRGVQSLVAGVHGRPPSSLPHPDVAPTWHGYSTAAWDGDTLVVDSGGFNGRVWLDQLGKPSTEALHVTTKFRRKDFGHMEIGITIDDAEGVYETVGYDGRGHAASRNSAHGIHLPREREEDRREVNTAAPVLVTASSGCSCSASSSSPS